ncbi:hypothetical protein [uncultured Tateyamaria sp.]|uniref:hypothetical protein n=1 Tax=uncultured Tateyamaria sp. TaxID=455651 RepID=UPI002638BB3F|nr:hypothetical protein [uncultured Tateyamaria sp.]
MTGQVIRIARPVTLWSLHFIAIYALISAACAPRGLIDPDMMRGIAAIVTAGCAIVLLVWLVLGLRTARTLDADAPERPLNVAVIWSALISLLAIFANLWPVAVLATCAG